MAFLNTGIASGSLAGNGSVCVELDGAKVGLFRTPDGLFAIDNVCPHRGAPLNDGFVHDGAVTCPWHQWDFRLSDGRCVNVPNIRVATYSTEERDGTIWVDLKTNKESA
jgi:NAD(P)H-dependent nitrite reductase small subunit